MGSVSFLKEGLSTIKGNCTLILVNQKQLRPSIDFSIQTLLNDEKEPLILISASENGEVIAKQNTQGKFSIVDVFSREKNGFNKEKNVYFVDNPSNLTSIQIGIQKFSEKEEHRIIMFDSVSILSIYNSPENIGRFFYLFSNKVKLKGDSIILFATKESISEESLEMIKQFCDKVFDYSELFISSIELA
jgi:archaellum biogenesis ATPase FlaH